ncbi:MAG: PAS domain S-box protein, partial [Deltaproteobacteria bacterium]|nr:PAS domain S-box protein [Deltaproteobacteria bacterium]
MSEKLTGKKSLRSTSSSENISRERREAEEKLRENEQLFRSLTEKSFAAAFIVQDGKFRYINTSAIAYAGYTAEELIGRDSDIIVHPDDKEMVNEKAREMLQGRTSTPYEFRMVTKQGRIRLIIQIVSPIQYDGKPAILGNAIDVTERKQAEEALRESERRLADIIDFLPDATLAIDREGKVIAWNRAIEEMTGVKASEMLGKGDYEYALPFYGVRRPILLDLVLKPDQKIEQSYYSILEKQKDILIVETWVPFLKWKTAFLWAKATFLYDSKGDIVGAIESIRDITERKQAEKMLQESEEKYRSLAFTVDLMYLIDRDCRYLFMNEGYLSRLGIPLEDMKGKFYREFHPDDDSRVFEETVKRIFKTGQSVQHEHKSARDGRYFLRTLSPVKDSDGRTTAVTVVSKDITERKQAEEALRESERRLADIIDFLPDATLAIDRQGRVIAWNRAIEEMTGV